MEHTKEKESPIAMGLMITEPGFPLLPPKKVILVTDPGYPLDDAKRFGVITFLNDGRQPKYIFDLEGLAEYYRRRLQSQKVGPDDYVVVVGKMINTLVLVNVLLECFGKVNLLLFSATNRAYKARTVTRATFLGSPSEGAE
jgi:hypothetical protein